MKIATIVGARPQFIEAAVVSRAFREHRPAVREVLVHTGQHYDANMSDVFFDELDIPRPDYHLGIGGGTHGQNTGRMIEVIEGVLLQEKPDWALVYGDTDSTLAGALAAVKLHIHTGGACRGRAALVQPADAGGNQPGAHGPRRQPAVHPHRYRHPQFGQ